MILDTITRSIELLLEGAITTTEMSWVVAYADHTDETFVPGAGSGLSNGGTPVTIIAAPSASTQRQIKMLNIFNTDTVSHTVTIRLNDNTAMRNLIVTGTFLPGYQLVYTDTTGWTILDAEGRVLVNQKLSDLAIPKAFLNAKGDLISASADDTPVILTVSVKKFSKLYADSGETSGLKWGLRRYAQLEPFSFGAAVECTAGDGKAELHIPAHLAGLDLVECHAEVKTAGTGSIMTIQVRNVTQSGVNMLTTAITVDPGETGSDTAATPYDIDENNDDVAENDMIAIDFDTLHSTPAVGCIVSLGFA